MRRLFYWLILLTAGYAGASAVDSAIRRLLRPVVPVDFPAKRNVSGDINVSQSAAIGRLDLGIEVFVRPRHPLVLVPFRISEVTRTTASTQYFVVAPQVGHDRSRATDLEDKIHRLPGFHQDADSTMMSHDVAFVAQQPLTRNPRAALTEYFDPLATGVPNA